jgi:hypothetical protein
VNKGAINLDNQTRAEKLRAYYKNSPNKGKSPNFKRVKFSSHVEIIDKLMPYLEKRHYRYDSKSTNATTGTIINRVITSLGVRLPFRKGASRYDTIGALKNRTRDKMTDKEAFDKTMMQMHLESAKKDKDFDAAPLEDAFDLGFVEGYKQAEKRVIIRTVNVLRESSVSQEDIARTCLKLGFSRAELMDALGLSEQELWNLVPKTRRERNEDFVVEPFKFKSDEDMMRQLMPELFKKKGRSDK